MLLARHRQAYLRRRCRGGLLLAEEALTVFWILHEGCEESPSGLAEVPSERAWRIRLLKTFAP